MATTAYGVNANEAVKLWSRRLFAEIEKESVMADLIGTSGDSVIVAKEELSKGAGDRITCQLRVRLTGNGVEGDSTLEGNEEALTTYTQNLLINQLRHAVRSDGEMTEQRITWDIREQAMDGLRDWWADRMDTALINQVTGNTGQTDTRFTGHNATAAPTSATGNTRILYGGGTHTTENSLSAGSETMSLTYIDRAVLAAKTASPQIRMATTPWGKGYVMLLHPNVLHQLAVNSAANTINLHAIQLAQIQGGSEATMQKSAVRTIGLNTPRIWRYRDTFLVEDSRVPAAPNTTTVYRNVLMGAQAAIVGFGKRYGNRRMSWKEKLFDYDNQLGVKAGMIWGAVKAQYNSRDHATVVLSVHAPAL